jgi:hypothetical protein
MRERRDFAGAELLLWMWVSLLGLDWWGRRRRKVGFLLGWRLSVLEPSVCVCVRALLLFVSRFWHWISFVCLFVVGLRCLKSEIWKL